MPVSEFIDPLKPAKMTLEGALSQLNADKSNVLDVAALYGIVSPSEEEKAALKGSTDLRKTLVQLLATRANIGFTTGGHTGEDLFMYSYGPGKPVGFVENTDIAHSIASAMGFDLKKLDSQLFVKAEDAFKTIGATISVNTTNKENPILVVKKGKTVAELPVNKDIVVINGETKNLRSVTVQSNGTFYVSKEAVNLVKKGK
jgi:alkaline phosphatase